MRGYFDKKIVRGIRRLACVCIVLTLLLHGFLYVRLKNGETGNEAGDVISAAALVPAETAAGGASQESMPADAEDADSGATDAAHFETALRELDSRTAALLEQGMKDGSTLKYVYEAIVNLWNAEMERMVSAAAKGMPYEKQQDFLRGQADFVRERNSESVKSMEGSRGGSAESLEYLKKMADLTRQRCYDLLKDYYGLDVQRLKSP